MATKTLLFFVFLMHGILVSSQFSPLNFGTINDKGEICDKSMNTCNLVYTELTSSAVPQEEEVGDPGDPGLDGMPGRKGDKGISAEDQYTQGISAEDQYTQTHDLREDNAKFFPANSMISFSELAGAKGSIGPFGDDGKPGQYGFPGIPGEVGRPGYPGRPGFKGQKGEAGKLIYRDEGSAKPGPMGLPGSPGISGLDKCPSYDDEMETDTDSPRGTKDRPSKVLCRDMKIANTSEYYYIGPEAVKVECRDDGLTCIPPLHSSLHTSITLNSSEPLPLWLSSKGATVKAIYGVLPHQFSWIQRRSKLATQTIHCEGCLAYLEDNKKDPLKMLSFNGVVFGSTPRKSTPFTYYTDDNVVFKIKSEMVQRLPVIDFQPQNVKANGLYKITIIHKELCFK